RSADARPREDAHALAATAGCEGIERAHAEVELPLHSLPPVRRWRRVPERIEHAAGRQRSLAVDRPTHRVYDAAEPTLARADTRLPLHDFRLAAEADAVERAERHQQRPTVAKAYRFAWNRSTVARQNVAPTADGEPPANAADLDEHAEDAGHPAVKVLRRERFELCSQRLEESGHLLRQRCFPGLFGFWGTGETIAPHP